VTHSLKGAIISLGLRKLLVLELNELNFEFVEHYARIGALPAIAHLLGAHGYARTRSETAYEYIGPWTQWFTVHTGKAFGEHKVFRPGDGAACLGGRFFFQHPANPLPNLDQPVEIDAGPDAEAVQHVHHVLGRHVPEAPAAYGQPHDARGF